MSVTSGQIMEVCGIRNVKTLTRWHQAGLIPEPTIEAHPSGRGRTAYWPDWVLKHAQTVRKLKSQGLTNAEIAATFGSQWDSLAKRYQDYDFHTVNLQMDHDEQLAMLSAAVQDAIDAHFIGIRDRPRSLIPPQIDNYLTQVAMDLFTAGFNPVLIIAVDYKVVVPDFVISLYLAKHFNQAKPFSVVPLFQWVNQKRAPKYRRSAPDYAPVKEVGRGTLLGKRASVRLGTNWDYTINEDEL